VIRFSWDRNFTAADTASTASKLWLY